MLEAFLEIKLEPKFIIAFSGTNQGTANEGTLSLKNLAPSPNAVLPT